MNVLFAPDYCLHNPYQRLLAGALANSGSSVRFLSDYKRGLPLTRGFDPADQLLHLHWPEAYFRSGRGMVAGWIRALRYPIDLALATAKRPLIATAHNLFPHAVSPLSRRNMTLTYRRAKAVIAHSEKAADLMRETFGLGVDVLSVVPHGDLASGMPPLPDRREARRALGLREEERMALMFGTLAPYKGIEGASRLWTDSGIEGQFFVVGDSFDGTYGDQVEAELAPVQNVTLIRRRVDDAELAQWLASTDCALFNYDSILTSGSACLARSLGVPVVLPRRLETVDLGEPHPHVVRFDDEGADFGEAIDRAMSASRSDELRLEWCAETSWDQVAARTRHAYEDV